MYMLIDGGYAAPVKITSMRFVKSFEDIIRKFHIEYVNHQLEGKKDPPPWGYRECGNFEDYLDRCFNMLRIYECAETVYNPKTRKFKQPKNLLKEGNLVNIAKDLGYDLAQ